MAKQVTLNIDGVQATVPEGTSVVDAAKTIGIDIPVFCHHPKLEPVGMCRMCLVEIGRPVRDRATGEIVMENGAPKIQFLPKLETACTNKVEEGLVVRTNTQKAKDGQKSTVEFLLTSHPLDCPVCDKGGECPLQNLTIAYGPGKSRFLFDEKYHLGKHVPLGDLIVLDQERCIQCARCIRFQDEIVGDPVLGFDDRGRGTRIITSSDPPFESVFSGNTTDICPVCALTTTDFRFTARPWEMGAHPSICTQCPVGCNTTLNVRREPRASGDITVQRIMPRQNEEVNEIWMCDKGRFAYHYAESKKRLSYPTIRRNGEQVRASWDEAVRLAADKFKEAKSDLVVLASGRLSNEDLFNLKQLTDQAGGSALLYSRMGGGELTSLVGVGESNFAKMGAGSVIVVVASDLYEEAPIWYLRIKQASDRGATVIVLNPRETKLDRYAKFVVRYAYGDEVKSAAELGKRPGVIGALLGKDPNIAAAFREAGNVIVLYGSEGLGVSTSASLANACANLLQETGFAGKPNSGLIGVWERANDQGAWEMGFRAEEHLVDALSGKTVYLAGVDPVNDYPVLAEALKSAKFVAVQDVMETATTQVADVVFPAQAFTEREGTYTSGERRVQRFYIAVPVTGEAKADFAITANIAEQMGFTLEGASVSRAFDLLAAAVPSYAGLSYAKISEVRPQWPIVGRADLFYGGTSYENKGGMGAQLSSAASRSETVDLSKVEKEPTTLRPKENELLAIPINKLYDRGTTVMQSANRLRGWIGGPRIYVHPDTAEKMGVEDEQLVGLGFDGASGEVAVKLDPTIPVGVALVPRDMGLPIREPVPATVSALAKVK